MNRITPWMLGVAATGLLITTAGCGNAAAPSASSAKPITVVDDLGHKVTLDKPATRVVTIEPSNTEIMLQLGLKKDIVGIDQQSFQYTPSPWKGELAGLHSVGSSYPGISDEAIVAAKPNLVLATTGVKGLSGLAAFHIPVVVLNPQSINGVYHDMLLVGTLTGHLAQAQHQVSVMKQQIAAISEKVQSETKTRPTVFYDLGQLYTAGPTSFINSLIQLAGANNIVDKFSQQAYPQVSAEQVVKSNPDIIIVDPDATTVSQEDALPGFSATTAVKTHEVVSLPNSSYVNEPSPALVMGLKELVRIIHPHLAL